MVWLKFAACVIIILIAGRSVAKYGDAIADKTGLGGAWIGVVLIAITTSLPELFTGISSVSLVGAPDLTVGDLLGANTFNLLNLALLDIAYRHGPLLTAAAIGHTLTAGLSLILVALVAAGIFLSKYFNLGIGWTGIYMIGIYTPMIFLLYLAIIRMIFGYEKRQRAQSAENEAVPSAYKYISLKRVYLYYSIAAIFVIGAGVWLAFVGKEIADVTGWGQTFVGSLFIAFTTTIPEITVSFSALRLGAVDMCVGNMIGSNLFNMTIVGIDDLFYREGPVLSAVSQTHIITALAVVLMTGIFIAGLLSRPQRKTPIKASWYALALIGVFIIGAYLNFAIG